MTQINAVISSVTSPNQKKIRINRPHIFLINWFTNLSVKNIVPRTILMLWIVPSSNKNNRIIATCMHAQTHTGTHKEEKENDT